MKIFLILLLFISTIFSKEITLGVVPQQSPLKLSKKWLQITKYLSNKTGLNVVFKTEKSIPLFEKVLYSGGYDFAYMNPYHFIMANEKQNYTAKIRADKQIVGILVSKDKTLKLSIDTLKNRNILFPAPKAFAATMLTKHELNSKFNIDVEKNMNILYVNSHDSVYKGIARNIGVIGGGIERTFINFDKKEGEEINIIYRTKDYPSHPFAFHPRVSKDDVKLLKDAFLSMPVELKKILSIKNFIQTENKEFDSIKAFK